MLTAVYKLKGERFEMLIIGERINVITKVA